MAYFLGIDAGGTRTRVALATDGAVVAEATTGSIKLIRSGTLEATDRLRAVIQEACASAGVRPREITHSCIGLAGISIPSVQTWAHAFFDEHVGGTVDLVGDETIALDAAFQGESGVLVIAGTGSHVIGRMVLADQDGIASEQIFRAGGWGPELGDEGSGFWIGRQAVRAALWARDRGLETTLLEALKQAWGAEFLGDLVERGNAAKVGDFAMLAPVVAQCAEEGDEIAEGILTDAGEELGDQIFAVWRQMEQAGAREEDGLDLAYTGSVLEHIGVVREEMLGSFALNGPELRVHSEAIRPIDGALWRARRKFVSVRPAAM
jgi:glucosamine kinase